MTSHLAISSVQLRAEPHDQGQMDECFLLQRYVVFPSLPNIYTASGMIPERTCVPTNTGN